MTQADLLTSVVQVLIALIASGILVKVLTLRQDRRKIAGDATAQEANAASTLSGAALEMVRQAQTSAKESDAKASEAKAESERLWIELNKARWKLYYHQQHIDMMEQAMRDAGIMVPIPPMLRPEEATGERPPPELR